MMALAAGAAVYVYAQRRSEETGRDLGTVLSNLPQELKESSGVLKQHMGEAAIAGRKAAMEREAEIDRQLSGEEDLEVPIKDYIV
ncbi:MAG: hypothetical protein WC828_07850 [Thermoleophilia bacterium]